MNDINFLPQSYLREQKRLRRIYWEVVIVSTVVMILLGSFVVLHNRVSKTGEKAADLKEKVEIAIKQKHELQRLMKEHASLSHQVKIQRELASSLGYHQVIAVIGSVMPNMVALTDLQITSTKPSVQDNPNSGKTQGKKPDKQSGASVQMMHIDMTGVAPNNDSITDFISQLTNHKMFTNTRTHYVRSKNVKETNYHEFRIEMDIPLNREYRPTEQKKIAGVTDAD